MPSSRAFWILSGALALATGINAAQPGPSPQNQTAATAVAPIDRALVDRYCVTCHNQRTKSGDLTLDTVDFTHVAANAEVLEKVVHKLRAGQMPPAGARRPDKAAASAFASSLEEALDAVAAASPNPGRFPVHRLNRVEYVNAVHDVLALDIDGGALLPADNSGLGFDNNADVLSVTPALMARYMSAATKISRLAVGDPAIRPVNQVYAASQFGRQDSRTSEDLAFGTHGGLSVRHAFP